MSLTCWSPPQTAPSSASWTLQTADAGCHPHETSSHDGPAAGNGVPAASRPADGHDRSPTAPGQAAAVIAWIREGDGPAEDAEAFKRCHDEAAREALFWPAGLVSPPPPSRALPYLPTDARTQTCARR